MPFKILDLNGSGKPPAGTPNFPFIKSSTLSGKSYCSAFSTTVFSSRPFYTKNRAKSPTTFDEGVTLTIPPKILFATEYASFTSSHLSPRPIYSD